MRKKLKNSLEVESSKFKVKSGINSFNFKLLTFNFLIALLIALLIVSCTSSDSGHEHSDTYTCPMHPTVVSDKPGVCPVCAMDLVRKARPGEEVQITEELARLIKSTNELVLANVKTVRGEYKSVPVSLSLKGVVTYDERQIFNISSRIGGRLEKVFIKYMFQRVSKGQKIAEVYSAELVSAQREYLYLLKNDASNVSLIEAARNKLLLLGMSEAQLSELKRNQEISYTFAVYSPYSGYVISETQIAPVVNGSSVATSSAGSGGMGMGGTGAGPTSVATPSSAGELIRAGNYVSAGQTLFRIVNADKIWIEFNVPVSQAGYVKKGESLDLDIDGKKMNASIDFIEPFFNNGEDFVKLRSYLNRDNLVIGQLADATLSVKSADSLWLPVTSLLDLGNEQIVFVKDRGVFKPRKVKTGSVSATQVEIKSGLTSGDEVAIEAHYLIDSENFVKTSN